MSLRFSSTRLEISSRERRTSPAEPGPREEGGWEVGAGAEANDVSVAWIFRKRALDDPFRTPNLEDLRLVISVGVWAKENGRSYLSDSKDPNVRPGRHIRRFDGRLERQSTQNMYRLAWRV